MVWSRKIGRRTVYYAVFRWRGKPVREPVDGDKRYAAKVERERKIEVANGTYDGPKVHVSSSMTIDAYADEWFKRRKNRTKHDDEQRFRDHVSPKLGKVKLGDLRPRDVEIWIHALRDAGLSASLVRNSHAVLVALLGAAHFEELVERNAARGMPKGTLPRRPKRNVPPGPRDDAPKLFTDERIDPDRRALYAMLYLGGMRLGEACGRRWKDLDTEARPLWMMRIHDQYDGLPLKTAEGEDTGERFLPVHPALRSILAEWKTFGWPMLFGREPGPNDFIVPDPKKARRFRVRTENMGVKALYRDCDRLGIARRGTHSGRRWFTSYARSDGAREELLERVTHNARGAMIDRYTYFGWAELCAEVAKLRVELPPKAAAAPLALAAGDHENAHRFQDEEEIMLKSETYDGGGGGTRSRVHSHKSSKTSANEAKGADGTAARFRGESRDTRRLITTVIAEHGLEDCPRLRRAMGELVRRLSEG